MKKGIAYFQHAALLRIPLLGISCVYGAVISIRRKLYNAGILKTVRLPVPVISVGNITMGGNGKTPMTEFLGWTFLRAGINPMLLTRGYAGGDEARLLQSHFKNTSAEIGVGANRCEVGQSILKRCGFVGHEKLQTRQEGDSRIGVAILDDGMQHLRIFRDLEIVMVNALSQFGNERLIPAGLLREPLSSLSRADIIVIHHANLVSKQKMMEIQLKLQGFSGYKVFMYSEMIPECFIRSMSPHETVTLDVVRDAPVVCITGLGCPESLALTLQELGAEIRERMDYIDHHEFTKKDLLDMETKLQELSCFLGRKVLAITSEKDYMRNTKLWEEHNVLVLQSCLRLVDSSGDSIVRSVFPG